MEISRGHYRYLGSIEPTNIFWWRSLIFFNIYLVLPGIKYTLLTWTTRLVVCSHNLNKKCLCLLFDWPTQCGWCFVTWSRSLEFNLVIAAVCVCARRLVSWERRVTEESKFRVFFSCCLRCSFKFETLRMSRVREKCKLFVLKITANKNVTTCD